MDLPATKPAPGRAPVLVLALLPLVGLLGLLALVLARDPLSGFRPSPPIEEATVELAPPELHPDGEVRYTLDGSDPTAASPLFTAPFVLTATTTVSARLFLPGGRSSAVTRGTFERTLLRPAPADAPPREALVPGVRYAYFETAVRALPDFARLVPVAVGNPHAVVLREALSRDDLLRFGPAIEGHPRFRNRTNVQLARPEPRDVVIHDVGGTTGDARWVPVERLGDYPLSRSWHHLSEAYLGRP